MVHRGLVAGDLVEVRSAGEILATLDDSGALEALPFMPEMLPYIGRRFVVDKRADKICDTIAQTGSRRLNDAVLLGDLRCDGRAHAGCQAECRLFWKERWLRPVESLRPVSAPESEDPSYQTLRWLVDANRQR
ncbi:MAG TPA: hypothetical protein VM691_13170, partial [Myxococcales bacterium]|nr:hypothetical protein [Myxococcales bacterium]